MLVFSVVYWLVLRRLVQSEDMDYRSLSVPAFSTRQRAFRIRLFEPIHRQNVPHIRSIIPLWDALALSFRSFTKIGLGASYPNTRLLKFLTGFEWFLGVYMIIHFILAVKNNLPFILPFLGVVN
jgi:hypothetical protein